jgi:hypothetical protein
MWRRKATGVAALVIGAFLIIAGLVDHEIIASKNALCQSPIGQLGSAFDNTVAHDCGLVTALESAVGWLIVVGILGLILGIVVIRNSRAVSQAAAAPAGPWSAAPPGPWSAGPPSPGPAAPAGPWSAGPPPPGPAAPAGPWPAGPPSPGPAGPWSPGPPSSGPAAPAGPLPVQPPPGGPAAPPASWPAPPASPGPAVPPVPGPASGPADRPWWNQT